jgi:hypothetical protein
MSRLSAAQRKALPKSEFGLPGKAKTPAGKAKGGSYPIPDKAHAAAAKSRAAQFATPAQRKVIDAKANRVLKGKGR